MEFLFAQNKMNKLKEKNRDSDHKVRKNLENCLLVFFFWIFNVYLNCHFFWKSYPIDTKHRRIYPWQWVLPTLLQLQVCMLQCKQFVDVDRWPKSVAHTVRASGGVQKLRGDESESVLMPWIWISILKHHIKGSLAQNGWSPNSWNMLKWHNIGPEMVGLSWVSHQDVDSKWNPCLFNGKGCFIWGGKAKRF